MAIRIHGATEHNLCDIDVSFGDGLTVVTGISGSGKSSLVFDTLYHEARRRFLEVFGVGSIGLRLSPARVREITGLGPAIAVGQNLLNRNPSSTLATASGLHPFLRLLYANYGERYCAHCGESLSVMAEDEIVARIASLGARGGATIYAPLLRGVPGSHATLLALLTDQFGADGLRVDGAAWTGAAIDPTIGHDLDIALAQLAPGDAPGTLRQAVQCAWHLGAHAIRVVPQNGGDVILSRAPVCVACGAWFGELRAVHFHTPCPACSGEGCERCGATGLHPEAAAVRWQGLRLPELLTRSVGDAGDLVAAAEWHASAARLRSEIGRRLDALQRVGLGYVGLDRPSPTLSRGEAQRVRLAVALTSRLEDMLHVLDEPTIGQHPADVARLLPAFRELAGPVVYVEHDRAAAALADRAVDLGPGAGSAGGHLTFVGTPAQLWQADTPTGRYFSLRERVHAPLHRSPPTAFLTVRGARLRNLDGIDVPLAMRRLNVVTGVSGSGKSTLVRDVLVASLRADEPVGCECLDGPTLQPVMVDQSPIGRNPRSNPATYTKLSDIVRDLYAVETGLSASHFSFNRPEGACPACKGIGAQEVKMRYMASTWLRCADCDGQRFSEQVLAARAAFGGRALSIADFYELTVSEALPLLERHVALDARKRGSAVRILRAMRDVGLGYLPLGQPSTTLSGGEAQRIKLCKFLGRHTLAKQLLVLDEPSTGLHPQDIAGLLVVLDRLVRGGATIVVVEHNTDVIRAADWVVDLGPGAGPRGGRLLHAGSVDALVASPDSITGRALREEENIAPQLERAPTEGKDAPGRLSDTISIRGACVHNLKNVSVELPKRALTVVTGLSGSGKSSLVVDVLEAEARRRFLETLSLYERQGTREGPEALVERVSGLGVALTVRPWRRLHSRRATVGSVTEMTHHLAVLLAHLGERACQKCGVPMVRGDVWECPACGAEARIGAPRHFIASNYAAACKTCNGVGSLRKPNPSKLIIHPEAPLCGGAMYSPGFFPKGYLCKPFNGGYDMVQALAERYRFDPAATPWSEMTPEAQQAFLFGDPVPMDVTYRSRKGRVDVRTQRFPGFYGWISDWDVGGTYTDTEICSACGGGGLRPDYATVTLGGHIPHELNEMPLVQLGELLADVPNSPDERVAGSLHTARHRLAFLCQVGLGYIHLGRPASTLSAGEAQRIRLASLLGSGLTSLTVLIDEPSRGLHPSEVGALLDALRSLRDEGNTVVVVEHDPVLIEAADHLIDMGPGAGASGGRVVAQGSPSAVAHTDTVTAQWLCGARRVAARRYRRPSRGWLTIRGARANNLAGLDVSLPTGVLVGLCGVSGSGKSTLLIDTLGRRVAPKKQTTSVAYEDVDPGEHDAVEGLPPRAIVVDQARAGVVSASRYMGLEKALLALFAASADAQALGLDEKAISRRCSACQGKGATAIEMGFLPDVHVACEICGGTGYAAEAWDVRLHGLALPETLALTIDEVYDRYASDDAKLARLLRAVRAVGLGYLVLRQPGQALSGGEVQRLKIAKELCRTASTETLYILDEPTVGQHLEDVARLIEVLHRLVDAGHSVMVVEHHAHLLACCDWLVELGPGGGPDGGHLVAQGTPETLAVGDTATAPYLREILEAGR